MNKEFVITDDTGKKQQITGIRHPDWESMEQECPECGGRDYRHFATDGGRYGLHQETIIMRNDYWDANRPLLTQCLSCDEILHKHPAFDLLYKTDSDDSLGLF
ncbi:hypothetical protein [Halorientalis halophila]|uniref:hypothetical protein n=1 Tax=Halorientalis halophila TaxID=3108499 RepID=UPI003007F7BE